MAASLRVPYNVTRTKTYRIEKYTGDHTDYFKVYRLLDEKHIATVYSEKALQLFLTN